MRTYTATIFWNEQEHRVFALVTDGSMLSEYWNTPLGSFEFTLKTMPDPDKIKAWAVARLQLLGIQHQPSMIRVRSYLKNAAPWRRDRPWKP